MTDADRGQGAISATVSGDDDGEVSQQRRRVLTTSGAVLAITVVGLTFVLAVDTVSAGETGVLVGAVTSRQLIGIFALLGLLALSVGLCAVLVEGWWHLVMVPARIAAIVATVLAAGFWLLFLSGETVTPILAGGCRTGYVAVERSLLLLSAGSIERQDGIFTTPLDQISADDGFHPFARGAYTAEYRGDEVLIQYDIYGPARGTFTGPVARTVPAIAGVDSSCTL